MKIAKLTLFLLFCISLTTLAKDKPKENHVSVLLAKREIFYFRVSKEFIGATVDVYDESGKMIVSEKVTRRKTVVDFAHRNPGLYTIRVTKGELSEEFECSYNVR